MTPVVAMVRLAVGTVPEVPVDAAAVEVAEAGAVDAALANAIGSSGSTRSALRRSPSQSKCSSLGSPTTNPSKPETRRIQALVCQLSTGARSGKIGGNAMRKCLASACTNGSYMLPQFTKLVFHACAVAHRKAFVFR